MPSRVFIINENTFAGNCISGPGTYAMSDPICWETHFRPSNNNNNNGNSATEEGLSPNR